MELALVELQIVYHQQNKPQYHQAQVNLEYRNQLSIN